MPESKDGASHPDEQVTASYLDGTLPGPARDRFEAHLAVCDGCRAGVALVGATPYSMSGAPSLADADFELAPPEFIAHARQNVKTARTAGGIASSRRGLLTAAALLAGFAALATLMLVWSPQKENRLDDPAYRGKEASPFGDLRPAAGSIVPLDNLVFYWSPIAGADRYVVSVADSEGRTVAAIEAAGGARSIDWPSGLTPPAGGQLTWRIKALALDRLVAESRPIPFEGR